MTECFYCLLKDSCELNKQAMHDYNIYYDKLRNHQKKRIGIQLEKKCDFGVKYE